MIVVYCVYRNFNFSGYIVVVGKMKLCVDSFVEIKKMNLMNIEFLLVEWLFYIM